MSDQVLLEQLRDQIGAIENNTPSVRKTKGSFSKGHASRQESIDASSTNDAFKKVIALVNVSDRSERQIRDRLAKSGFDEVAIDEAVERSRECGFIDDMRYASVLIRSRLSQGKGASGIERELIGEGIDIELVPGWPEEFGVDEASELDRALGVLEKKPPRSKNKRDGAYRKLIGKGFSSSIASSAARIWSESHDVS